jgi:hypothetical protein
MWAVLLADVVGIAGLDYVPHDFSLLHARDQPAGDTWHVVTQHHFQIQIKYTRPLIGSFL